MRLSYLPCTLALLLACGPGGGTSDTSGASTSSTTAASSEPTTDPTATGTSTTSPTTGEPTTTTEDPTGTTLATTVSSTGDPTTTTTTTTTTATTGGPDTTTGAPVEPCVTDDDCTLRDDCCACEALPAGTATPECMGECQQTACAAVGVDAAVCRLGVCHTERLSCDQSAIACEQAPPPCDPGTLPETTPSCYTGNCVPSSLCDVVASCDDCPDGTMCVQNVGFAVDRVTCEPIPPACDGVVDCACVGDLVCTDIYTACSAQGAVVRCECPNC